ncbi:MAG: radical SAM protein [Candidatus Obscuribacterales bacterium]|nr:radical SAM protein [Candidatus Obscuribacterales bacterium]
MIDSLAAIEHKIQTGERITKDDARLLWHKSSEKNLCRLATSVRNRFHKTHEATYIVMGIVNYTNICVAKCDYCAFARAPNASDSYVLSKEQIFDRIEHLIRRGAELVCFNGGFNPRLKIDFYCDLFASIRSRFGGNIEFYALTVAELIYIARTSNKSIEESLDLLKKSGVKWITGGGAEILNDNFRQRHSPFKYTVPEYFRAQRQILEAGLNSTATMVIGFDETLTERLEHLESLRRFQDDVKKDLQRGLSSFLCWTYKPQNTSLGGTEIESSEYLRHLAISRIYLDNIPHIRASVLTQSTEAVRGLSFGADDFDLPLEDEVTEKAGVKIECDYRQLLRQVESVGFVPLKRTASLCMQN